MSTSEPIAIDFGTSNSLVGMHLPDGGSRVLPMDPSHPNDPSLFRTLVYFPNQNQAYYGTEAINQYVDNGMEGRLFRSFKAHLPNTDYLGTMVEQRRLPLEELVGTFLLEIKKRAEKILGRTVDSAVFGRPAKYSMDDYKHGFALHRMNKAAKFAGFKKWTYVPEPLAAAINFRGKIDSEKLVLIGDFGGGTSDFTIMKMSPRSFHRDDILAIHGCSYAGDSFDSSMMKNRLNIHFGAQSRYQLPMSSNVLTTPPGIRMKLDLPAFIVHLKEKETFEFLRTIEKTTFSEQDRTRIRQLLVLVEDQQIFQFFEKIEENKRQLSKTDDAQFEFHYPGIDVSEKISRSQFETWAQQPVQEILASLDETLKLAGLSPSQIDSICLTGGTAKVPIIYRSLEERFGKNKLVTTAEFHSVIEGLVSSIPLWQNDSLPFESFDA